MIATVCYSMFPEKEFAFGNVIVHAFFGTSGIILISLSLIAAVRYKDFNFQRHLSTSHAWLGILAIVLYMYNYLNGFLTYFFGDTTNYLWAYRHHCIIGIAALHATTISITTGISESTSWCDDQVNFNISLLNSAVHFYCRANSTVSLLVVITFFAVLVAVLLHNHLKQRDDIRKKMLSLGRLSEEEIIINNNSVNTDFKTDEYNHAQVESTTHIL